MTVAVITSIYGAYDTLDEPPAQAVDARWIAVTDGTVEIPSDSIWEPILWPSSATPQVAAKFPKCVPSRFVDADRYVWLDGNARLTRSTSLARLLEWSDGHPIAQFAHPERDCCWDEAIACAQLGKADSVALLEQAARFTDHPLGWGLWATGVIVRDRLDDFGADWLTELIQQPRDQVSQPVILRRHDLRPHTFPADLWDNEAIVLAAHR